jgi:hypothetical protein
MDETSIHPRILNALTRVRAAKRGVAESIISEAYAVRAAREAGVTWERIGDAYGISKQAAAQRWPDTKRRPIHERD